MGDFSNPTAEIRPEWVQPDGSLDGVYFAHSAGVRDGQVVFELDRIWFDDACRDEFGDAASACLNGHDPYPGEPHGSMAMPNDVSNVTVCGRVWPQDPCYRIDAEELRKLMESDGNVVSQEAPGDFDFGHWAWWVIVEDGEITGAHTMLMS